MDLFKDKKFEEFDELTQLIEPFIFELNTVLGKVPEENNLSFEDIIKLTDGRIDSRGLNKRDVLEFIYKRNNCDISDMSYENKREISNCFVFEIIGDCAIDASVPSMTGAITLVKTRSQYNDNEIMDYMVNHMSDAMFRGIRKASQTTASRFHEIAESFGFLEEMKKCTAHKQRTRLLKDKIVSCVKDNEIRIRDVNLGIRFGRWINKWLCDGNLAALKNIATLKIVSHADKAIYSINEEQV